ncbi:MAG: response regulator, partial [Spirochaetales bacterium]|nr:response regulator [Spirochaetales bacterium]
MKILIIDDEQGIRDILTDILNDEGHKMLSAADGEEGLALLKTNEVELVLLDVWMPNLGGLETLEVIRRDYPNVT